MRKLLLTSASILCLALPSESIAFGLKAKGVAGYNPGAIKTTRYSTATKFGTASALTSAGTLVTGGDTGALADTSKLTLAFSVKCTAGSAATNAVNATSCVNGDWFANFGNATSCNGGQCGSEGNAGIDLSFDNASGFYGTLRINFGDTLATFANQGTTHSCNYQVNSALTPGVWQHFLIEADLSSTASSAKKVTVYKNGVKQGTGGCTASGYAAAAFPINVSAAVGWTLTTPITGGGGNTVAADLADVYLDFSHSDVDSSNNLSAAAIAKFYDTANSRPVYTGANCELPFGAPAHICLRTPPGGTTADFIVNKGTITGLSLIAGAIYNAPAGPTAPPTNRAYIDWMTSAVVGNGTSKTTNSNSNTIVAGSLLIAGINIEDNAKSTGDHTPVCPTGFTQDYRAWNNGAADFPTDVVVCHKIADATDAAGTGAYQFTWTTTQTRGGIWTLAQILNVNPSSPIDQVAGQISGAAASSVNVVCPTLGSLTLANNLLLNMAYIYSTGTITLPASKDLADISNSGSGQPYVAIYEQLTTSTAPGTRTFVDSTSTSGQCISMAIKAN